MESAPSAPAEPSLIERLAKLQALIKEDKLFSLNHHNNSRTLFQNLQTLHKQFYAAAIHLLVTMQKTKNHVHNEKKPEPRKSIAASAESHFSTAYSRLFSLLNLLRNDAALFRAFLIKIKEGSTEQDEMLAENLVFLFFPEPTAVDKEELLIRRIYQILLVDLEESEKINSAVFRGFFQEIFKQLIRTPQARNYIKYMFTTIYDRIDFKFLETIVFDLQKIRDRTYARNMERNMRMNKKELAESRNATERIPATDSGYLQRE